jgi:putative Ca2+/H+ antiporter (TMEM165/GDT1 family)
MEMEVSIDPSSGECCPRRPVVLFCVGKILRAHRGSFASLVFLLWYAFRTYVGNVRTAIDPLLAMPLETQDPLSSGNIFSGFLTGGSQLASAFVNSLLVILVTEIGDKTFFIAAVLAMSHSRMVVYLGAMSALALMHVLSSIMGYALPNLLPRQYTHFASACLFVYFGLKLLKDAAEMKDEGPNEELQEVEEELINKKGATGEDEEQASSSSDKPEGAKVFHAHDNQAIQVFTQAFTLTFLAEWGDRSQIATIALAASKNVLGVIIGGLIGHAFCTGVAVVGGRLLAARISERTVAIVGGVSFVACAVHSFMTGP